MSLRCPTYYPFSVVYYVDCPVVADSEAITGTSLQPLAAQRSWVITEIEHGPNDPRPVLLLDLVELLLRFTLDEDPVRHQGPSFGIRPSSISLTAWSKGINSSSSRSSSATASS